MECRRQQQAQSPKDIRKEQENVSDVFNSASQLKEQEWMGAGMLNDQNHELKEKEGRYCDVCTPNGCICPSTWVNKSNHIENEETEEKEPEQSDWDTDLEEAQDYNARVSAPVRRPRQPLKVLMFQTQKFPASV